MVSEFPDLQGIMGGHYAAHDGEPTDVCTAIAQHYRPTAAGGELPDSDIGCCVSLADKLDTIVGLFGIGEPPTGSRDPYALRRAAIGVIRIIVEGSLGLSVKRLLEVTSAAHAGAYPTEPVFEYLADRVRYWYQDEGVATDVVVAALGAESSIDSLVDTDQRVRALAAFHDTSACRDVAGANKRIVNILKPTDAAVDTALFDSEAERALYAQVLRTGDALMQLESVTDKLHKLAELYPALDRFFDDVMVMVDDDSVRSNRLALLRDTRAMFLQVADLSELQLPGDG